MFKTHTLLLLLCMAGLRMHAQKFIESYNKGNYEKSLAQVEKAIDEDAKNLEAWLYKSMNYMHLATNEETKADHNFGIESSLTAMRSLKTKDKQGTFLPAHEEQFDSVINTASAYAFQLYDAEKFTRLEKMIDKLVELSPQPEHYFLKGRLLQESGDEVEAMKAYNAASAKIYLDFKKGKIPEPYLSETFIALAESLADDFSSSCVIYCRAMDIFQLEEVENACYNFLSQRESYLGVYSTHDYFREFFHYTDSVILFAQSPQKFVDLQWAATRKYYEGMVESYRYIIADSLMADRSCGKEKGYSFILSRIIQQTGIAYSLQQKSIADAREELLIYLHIANCENTPSENELLLVTEADAMMTRGEYTNAARLFYNLKLVSSDKALLTQTEEKLFQSMKNLPDTSLANIDLYEIAQYFPANKNIKTLQQNASLILIDKYIREKKFSEAGNLLRKQITLYPKDASLRSLMRIWVIEDYKTNYLGSETAYTELGWTGDYENCDAGKISDVANKKLLQRLNYIRRLADIPDQCILRDEWNKRCQAAALMMGANGQLSHSPPEDWKCFTAEGRAGAGNSNLALGASNVDALMLQLDDDGIPSAGHRRWILNPYRKVFGHGSTSGAMALWALGGKDANFPEEMTKQFETKFVAWPPEGYVPANFNSYYWSFALDNCDFASATVEMKAGNQKLNCRILEQEFGYGQNTLVWYIDDMAIFATEEMSYTVTLKHVEIYNYTDDSDEKEYRDFTYTVTFIPMSGH